MKKISLKSMIVLILSMSFLFCFADKWQDDYDEADGLYWDGYYKEAKEKAEELIDFSKDEFGVNSPEMGHAYNILGLINNKLGNTTLAEENFRNGITSFEKAGSKEKKNVAILKGNLGDLLYQNFYDEEAQEYLEDAIKMLEELNDKGDYNGNLEVPYYDLYSIYYGGEYYTKAASMLKKLIEIEKANYGKSDTLVGIDLKNLGWVYVKSGDYSEAESYMKQSLEVLEKNGGVDKGQLGLAYNDFGVLYDYKEDYSKAITYYKKAADVFKNSGNDKELGNTYNNLGLAHEKLGEFSSAGSYYEKAYYLYKDVYGEDDENTIEVKANWDAVKQ
ncbi:MAG: tetratricopeptide repeat protein [bacterium]